MDFKLIRDMEDSLKALGAAVTGVTISMRPADYERLRSYFIDKSSVGIKGIADSGFTKIHLPSGYVLNVIQLTD